MTVTEETLELPPAASVEAILAAEDNAGNRIDVPEWGVSVVVRGFTRAEVSKLGEIDDEVESYAFIIQAGMVEPAVTIEQAREIIATKSFAPVSRLVSEVLRLSGIGARFPVEEPGGVVSDSASV